MSYSQMIAVKVEALAVAMNAKVNALDAEAVDNLRQITEEQMTHNDALFRAVMDFATQYPLIARNPDALFARGESLHNAIIADNNTAALAADFGGGFDG